ncbi:MAG: T9SS type A sorting domain-containing protein [Saprospiraceae bacterium]|nr:T9SS type A sorting domain-containing protein [Candidatus Opimibacter iunctus]
MTKSHCLSIGLLCLVTIALNGQSGTLDTTFDGDGIVTRDIASFDYGVGAVLQPDGKILTAVNTNGGTNGDFSVVRCLQYGTLDESFGIGGVVLADRDISAERAHALVLQPDGRIVVAGEAQANGQYDFAVLRLLPDGTPDSTFGTNGWTVTDLGSTFEFPNCVALQSDGKIVMAGRVADGFNSNFAMVRYTPDGVLDTFFGVDGIVNTNIRDEDEATSIIIEPDDQIILGGYSSVAASGDFTLARYNTDGTLDKFFGNGGKVLTDLENVNGSDFIKAMVLQPDGKIIAAGNANNVNIELTSDAGMVRYEEDGDLDMTFGIGGIYIVSLGSKTDIYGIALQPNGKILLTGNSDVMGFEKRILLARFRPEGGLDTTFGNQGIITTGFPGDRESASSVLVQPDSKIVIAGTQGTQNNYDLTLLRYIADFVLTANITPLNCYGIADAAITIDASGGVAPYTYSLNGVDFQASNVFSDLGPGTYSITIKDSNGDGVTGTYGPITIDDVPAPPAVIVYAEADSDQIIIEIEGSPDGYLYSIDGGITFQSENLFTDLADGTYTVVVLDPNGCTIHTEQVHISTLGIATLRYNLPFTISPNPTSGLIQLDLRDVEANELQCYITDIAGREVYSASLNKGGQFIVNLDLNNLGNGSYLLRIYDGRRWGVKKLVVAR